MAIAYTVEDYIVQHGIKYDVVSHPHSHNSMETAELAHVPGERLAKSVVLEDNNGFVMAVLPSTCHIKLRKVNRALKRKLRLATENELPMLFADCERGAVPAIGLAYGMTTVVDDSLADQPEIYFEAGDHEKLIHMEKQDFMALMDRAGHARFAAHM